MARARVIDVHPGRRIGDGSRCDRAARHSAGLAGLGSCRQGSVLNLTVTVRPRCQGSCPKATAGEVNRDLRALLLPGGFLKASIERAPA